jgi:hypothetical protein
MTKDRPALSPEKAVQDYTMTLHLYITYQYLSKVLGGPRQPDVLTDWLTDWVTGLKNDSPSIVKLLYDAQPILLGPSET